MDQQPTPTSETLTARLRRFFHPPITSVARFIVRLGIGADALTITGQVLAGVGGYFAARGQFGLAGLMIVLGIFYVILGFFLDSISITVMSLPICLPLVVKAGYDPIWFGVFLVAMTELAQITPPVGFNLFVIQGMTGRSIGSVAWAAAPFFVLMVIGVVIITFFPQIALWLPTLLLGGQH